MRVLIADDHPMVADALSVYLREVDPDTEITISQSLDQALNVVREDSRYDVVFLDKNMPGMHGLDGLTRFRKCLPDTPTVIISGLASRADILEAFERGAVGFIPKDMSSDAIIKALGLVMAGEKYVPFQIIGPNDAAGESGRGGNDPDWGPDNPLATLTPRERQVLSQVLDGCSNKEIARELGVKEITVAFHLRGVFKKLGASNRTHAATLALKLGWS